MIIITDESKRLQLIENKNIFSLKEIIKEETEDKKLEVLNVVKNTISTIKDRGSEINGANKEQLKMAANILLSKHKTNKPVVIPMEMGLGKSTLIEEFLKYKVNTDDRFGAIVVKERIEDVLALERCLSGKAKAVYSFYPEHCQKGHIEYKRMICKECEYRSGCKIKKAILEQSYYPIVIITAERFRREMLYNRNISKYKYFYGKLNQRLDREIIIIDEKPPITVNNTISRKAVQKVYETLRYFNDISLQKDIKKFKNHLNILNKKLSSLEISGYYIKPIDMEFNLPDKIKQYFTNNYEDNDIEIIEFIISIIRKGAVIRKDNIKLNIPRQLITIDYIEYKKNGIKTVIMDGTAMYDIDYSRAGTFCILDLPRLRSYHNVVIKNCPGMNVSRSSMRNKEYFDFKKLLEDIDYIKDKEIFILSYLQQKNIIKNIVKRSSLNINNKIAIDHFNNVKGKNNYSNYEVMIMLGNDNKGDAYYIAKSMSLGFKIEDFSYINKKEGRKAKDINLRTVTLSNMFCNILQNIFRIKIRRNVRTNIVLYSFISDIDMINIISEYFQDCQLESWYPNKFYRNYLKHIESKKEILELVEYIETYFAKNDIIKKKSIREHLNYNPDSPNKLARHLKNDYVQYILFNLGIVVKHHNLSKIA